MKRVFQKEDLQREIENLKFQGWKVEDVEKVEFYRVKFSKESGKKIQKKTGKIPFLRHLNKPMLIEICRTMDINYTSKYSHELIKELEKYNKGVILTAYNSVTA